MKHSFKYNQWLIILLTGIIYLSAVVSFRDNKTDNPSKKPTYTQTKQYLPGVTIQNHCNTYSSACLAHPSQTSFYNTRCTRRVNQRHYSSRFTQKQSGQEKANYASFFAGFSKLQLTHSKQTSSDCCFKQLCKLSI